MQHPDMSSAHQNELWVNLSSMGDTNVFDMLPKLQEMLYAQALQTTCDIPEEFHIVFPSDRKWRNQLYKKLVARQREQEEEKRLQ